jgi:hypothetical protein
MRALRSLLALAALLVPAPALADVTARYTAGSSTITVEAGDNGDSRLQLAGRTPFAMLRHGGVDYVVFTDSAGKVSVVLASELLSALLATSPPPPAMQQFNLESGPAESFAGYSGMTWRIAPQGEAPLALLMSPDPALAPIGQVFRNLAGLAADALAPLLGADANMSDQLRALFAKGTPLRILPPESGGPPVLELSSVSMAAIDPARFVVPGPLISADAAIAKLRPREFEPPPAAGVIVD